MSLTTEETTTLVGSFTARLAALNDMEECPHTAFPEVTDSPAMLAVIQETENDVLNFAALLFHGLVSEEDAVKMLEHALIVTAAFGMALGGAEAVSDSLAPSEEDWEAFFAANTVDVESLPGIDEIDDTTDSGDTPESV